MPFPSIAFLVSGGNTETILCKGSDQPFIKLGDTLDDACGECMDKVFRYIYENIPNVFPPNEVIKHGGAQISNWAYSYENLMKKAHSNDVWIKQNRIHFPTPLSSQKNCNFSFSGIKTYSIRYLEREMKEGRFDYEQVLRFSFYFERAIVNHLIRKLTFTIQSHPSIQSIVIILHWNKS